MRGNNIKLINVATNQEADYIVSAMNNKLNNPCWIDEDFYVFWNIYNNISWKHQSLLDDFQLALIRLKNIRIKETK